MIGVVLTYLQGNRKLSLTERETLDKYSELLFGRFKDQIEANDASYQALTNANRELTESYRALAESNRNLTSKITMLRRDVAENVERFEETARELSEARGELAEAKAIIARQDVELIALRAAQEREAVLIARVQELEAELESTRLKLALATRELESLR